MPRRLTGCGFVLASLLLGACANTEIRSRQTILDETLRSYAATIRWGDINQALAFIDPKERAAHPPSALDLARFKQVQVSGDNAQAPVPVNGTEVHQTVQIDLVNVNTQSARSVVDRQVWKYDEEGKHWWLTTGLPDITRSQ